MSAIWTQTYLFRDPGAAPDHLAITAWGRRFRVVPSEAVRRSASGRDVDVVIDVVGPAPAQTLAPPRPDDAESVGVVDDEEEEITEVAELRPGVIELVYESADDITVVKPGPAASAVADAATGGRRGA
jgi:hypothetical protein